MVKNGKELEAWTAFAAAALGGAFANDASEWSGHSRNAALAADELLKEWRERQLQAQTSP
jgi:hypothetical protein